MHRLRLAVLAAGVLAVAAPAQAARCGGDFNAFVAAMAQEAQAAGVSRAVIDGALGGVTQDGAVLAFDRRQRGTFNKTFEQYVATRRRHRPDQDRAGDAAASRRAAVAHRAAVRRAAADRRRIWGLESDFGKATSASCRCSACSPPGRTTRRTDCSRASCGGAEDRPARRTRPARQWSAPMPARSARPSSCRRPTSSMAWTSTATAMSNLRHSVPDVLASTANLLKTGGWRAGGDIMRARPISSDARVEQGGDLSQDHRLFRRSLICR